MAKSTRIEKYSKYRESIYKMDDGRLKTPPLPEQKLTVTSNPTTEANKATVIETNTGTISFDELMRKHQNLTKTDEGTLSQEEVQIIKKQTNTWKVIGVIALIIIVIFILIAIWAIVQSGGQ